MLTKSTIKFIKSLQEKKYRKQEQCFIVEGGKSVLEVLSSDYTVRMVLGTESFVQQLQVVKHEAEIYTVKPDVLSTLGEFQTNDAALAVVQMKERNTLSISQDNFTLLLDDIRDPGNLGTIIRTADWYGITQILASKETVDFYNTKVINATKGSFTRVVVDYTDLSEVLATNKLPVYGAFLAGKNVHDTVFPKAGLLLIGNESNGISEELSQKITHPITIPRLGQAESLNAAIATAILLDNIKR
jgi:RNA methyltransferase, TrmH family